MLFDLQSVAPKYQLFSMQKQPRRPSQCYFQLKQMKTGIFADVQEIRSGISNKPRGVELLQTTCDRRHLRTNLVQCWRLTEYSSFVSGPRLLLKPGASRTRTRNDLTASEQPQSVNSMGDNTAHLP